MDAAEYVTEIVVPTMLDFRRTPRDRRLAYLACMAVYHVKDHVAAASKKNGRQPPRGGIEALMEGECGDAFRIVQAVCNGVKHTWGSSSGGISFDVGSDWDRPPARAGELECGVSELGDGVGGRSASRRGQGIDLYFAARVTLIGFVRHFPGTLEGVSLTGLDEAEDERSLFSR